MPVMSSFLCLPLPKSVNQNPPELSNTKSFGAFRITLSPVASIPVEYKVVIWPVFGFTF